MTSIHIQNNGRTSFWTDFCYQFNNGDITVKFTASNSAKGLITGRNVTNTFSGNYIIDQKDSIDIINVVWTAINEPEWGILFHSIVNAENYKVIDERLVIFYNHKRNNITLEKDN
jgi:hypothetical protein